MCGLAASRSPSGRVRVARIARGEPPTEGRKEAIQEGRNVLLIAPTNWQTPPPLAVHDKADDVYDAHLIPRMPRSKDSLAVDHVTPVCCTACKERRKLLLMLKTAPVLLTDRQRHFRTYRPRRVTTTQRRITKKRDDRASTTTAPRPFLTLKSPKSPKSPHPLP